MPPVPWPQVIAHLASAAGDGAQAVADAAVRAVRDLVAAPSVALVRWNEGRPTLVAGLGDVPESFEPRLAEGAGRLAGRSVAVVSVDPRTDLIACRSLGPGFDESALDAIRAVAELVAWAGGGPAAPHTRLRGLATLVLGSLELDEVLMFTADAISRLLRAEIAGVLMLSASGEELEMRRAVGNTKLDTARLRIRRGQGLAGRVLAAGKPERVDDYSTDPRSAPEFMALSDVEGTCSAIAVPLLHNDKPIGVLCAWRRRRAPFTDEDESLFEGLGELCAAAIHNATCYGSLRSETDELEAAHRGLEERNQAAERDLEVHDALTRIAMEGEDVDVVVRTVASLTSSPAAIVTDDGRVLSAHAPARGSGQKLHQRLQQWVSQDGPASSPNGEAVTVEEQGSWMLVVPVRAVGVTFGHLGLALVAPPTSGDRRAAEQAAVVSALLLAREEANVAAARRLQSEFVWDLLDGRLPDSVEAGVRARHLGAGFHLPARIAAIEASGLAESATSGGWSAEHLERARANLSRLIAQQLEDAGIRGAVLARRADLFAAVLPRPRGDGEKGLRRLTEALTAVNWPAGVTARVGVSSPVEHVGGFPEAWREARLALSAATTEAPGLFEELGVLQFLLAPTSRAELDLFARRHLGPLLAYDTEHGTGLMRTLETYLATGGSTRRAAELLNVHHRTVSYRLQRVEDLTGLHLDDQDDRLHVQLAAKILALEARPTDPR